MLRIEIQHMPKNPYTRPGIKIHRHTGIAMHWVERPRATPESVIQDWMERNTYGSAHYVIGMDGRIIECVPPYEVAYHSGSREYTPLKELFAPYSSPNHTMIGIEMCNSDSTGWFPDQLLESAVDLCAQHCMTYSLNPFRDIVTHNMLVGWKECPRLWVREPWRLELFRKRVSLRINQIRQDNAQN